jgi:hypothetical protein
MGVYSADGFKYPIYMILHRSIPHIEAGDMIKCGSIPHIEDGTEGLICSALEVMDSTAQTVNCILLEID